METIRRDLHRLRGCVLVEVEYTIKDIKDGEMSLEFITTGRKTPPTVEGTEAHAPN